jgi:uncharacterized protein
LIHYFDASALVKRYVKESGTAAVGRWLRDAPTATCRLTEVEIASALARRWRAGDLSTEAHHAAAAMLRADLTRIHVVELAPSVVAAVHPLFARHALRAGDALQLAAALALRDGLSTELDFVCYDERLGHAARAEGLRVRP